MHAFILKVGCVFFVRMDRIRSFKAFPFSRYCEYIGRGSTQCKGRHEIEIMFKKKKVGQCKTCLKRRLNQTKSDHKKRGLRLKKQKTRELYLRRGFKNKAERKVFLL